MKTLVKDRLFPCIKRRLLVITLTTWASSSPLLFTPTLIYSHLFTFTSFFHSTTIPNIFRMGSCPVAVFLTAALQAFLTLFTEAYRTWVARFWLWQKGYTACVMNHWQKMEADAALMPFQQNGKNGETSHFSTLGVLTHYPKMVTSIASLVVTPEK